MVSTDLKQTDIRIGFALLPESAFAGVTTGILTRFRHPVERADEV